MNQKIARNIFRWH